MLTSLFYYEHYRPYIMKSSDSRAEKAPSLRRKRAGAGSETRPTEVALNKSLNKDVINYAKNIYRNTTDLKYTSKKLSKDIRNFSKLKNKKEFDQDTFENSFGRDLEQFASSYNKSVNFLKTQQHSRNLENAAERLENVVDGSEKILKTFGMQKDEEGKIESAPEKNTFWNGKNTERKAKAAEQLFSKMYAETAEILDAPMSKHMNFKSLNYYYNYEVDNVRVDSFQIIKTGLLVNLAL